MTGYLIASVVTAIVVLISVMFGYVIAKGSNEDSG